ncbi:MAG: hypothetical protein ACJA1A_001433 [Saprospiraceae bacterium]|jgi:hypothetical protein
MEIRGDPQNLSDKIDNLVDHLGVKNTPIRNFNTVNVSVSKERFGATKINDRRTFVYIKSKIRKGMLPDALSA